MDPATIMMLVQALAAFGGGMMGGKKDEIEQLSNFDPKQKKYFSGFMDKLNQLQGPGGGYDKAMGGLMDFIDPNSQAYKDFEQPYLQQFHQEIVPGLAEKFASMGAMGGGLSSSGFGQSLSAAGSNLQTNLAAMKSQMRRQSINDLLANYMGMSQMGLGAQPFSYLRQQNAPNPLGAGLQAVGGAKLSGYFNKE